MIYMTPSDDCRGKLHHVLFHRYCTVLYPYYPDDLTPLRGDDIYDPL